MNEPGSDTTHDYCLNGAFFTIHCLTPPGTSDTPPGNFAVAGVGNKVNWWTASDAAAFDERAQVLIDQYSEFMPLEGMRIDGRNTLPENLADLIGLRVALDAFKQTAQFKKNERIGGFTPLQRFLSREGVCRSRP